MRLWKKILLVILLLFIVLIIYLRLAVHEGKPKIVENADPEALALKMSQAVDAPGWDTVAYVSWTFPGGHDYVWDKKKNDALISWDDYVVHLDMDEVAGRAFKEGTELEEQKKGKAIQKAWSYWCNDSFWLSAPYKIYDPGTSRYIAKDADQREGLLIAYDSGGVTPGDQYLWFLDDAGRPTGFKMWVKIIPLGGVYASWEGWKPQESGAQLASEHTLSLGGIVLKLTDIKSGQSWSDLGYDESPINL